jgi:site-specific DNA-methyltransferase (adenine-specific)
VSTQNSHEETIVWRSLSELSRWDRNYRVGNVDAIIASIVRFGYNGALKVWLDGVVMAGNHALIALETMRANGAKIPKGLRQDGNEWLVPCIDVRHLSRTEASAYAIADNRTQELGQNDPERLAQLLSEVHESGDDLLGATGYSLRDLEQLLREAARIGAQAERDAPDPQLSRADELQGIWKTELGQLWQIGPHRLLCGDSTDLAGIARLMDGKLADCCWTDPPYGVSYVGKTKDALTIENDGAEDLPEFVRKAFAGIDLAIKPGAAIYVAHPAGKLSIPFGEAFTAQGWRLHQTLVWRKDSLVLGHSDYHYIHEPIYYGYKPAKGKRGRGHSGWYGSDSEVSVFDFPRPKRSEEHPTQKPVGLVAAMLANSSPPGGLVFEPFSGSGSTMCAAHSLERTCYAVELSPKYVAVDLQRMTDMGLEPVLLE